MCVLFVLRICFAYTMHVRNYVRTYMSIRIRVCAYIGDTVYNVCMYTCACVCRVPINIPLSHASLEKVKDH